MPLPLSQRRSPLTQIRWALVATLLLASANRLSAQEWNQWRGPTRDGFIPADQSPTEWPAKTKTLWQADVGEGYASPVIAGKHVFVHSRRDTTELVSAVELASGKIQWQQKYDARFNKNPYATRVAKGPHSTPLVLDGRLFTLGATGILSAWKTDDGSLAWRKDYSTSVDTSKLFCGTSASPIHDDGKLIVQVGSDTAGGRIIALDPATGDERWTWKGPGPGYATPIICTIEGTKQLISLTESSIVGLDPKVGKLLWSIPFPDEWQENIVTPIWTGKHLIVAGVRQGTHAYSLTRDNDTWKPVAAWKNPALTIYMSTPVLADGILYGFSNKKKGQFFAMDVSNGTVRWSTDGRAGEQAAVLRTDKHLIFLTNESDLIVAERVPAAYKQLQKYKVTDSETWTLPIPLADGFIIRDSNRLLRIGFEK